MTLVQIQNKHVSKVFIQNISQLSNQKDGKAGSKNNLRNGDLYNHPKEC